MTSTKADPAWWDSQAEDQALSRAMSGFYAEVGRDSLQMTSDTLGRIVSSSNVKRVIADLQQYGGDRITNINLATKTAIQDELTEGTRRGYSINQLISGVPEEGFRGVQGALLANGVPAFDPYRAEVISRTETMLSFNRAAVTSYREFGVQEVQAIDGDYDEECAARNGQTFSVEDALDIEDHPNGTLDWIPIVPGTEEEQAAEAAADELPAAFANVEELQAWGENNFSGWQSDLTKAESDAVKLYQSSGYHDMNAALRFDDFTTNYVGEELTAAEQAGLREEVDAVAAAIDKGRVPNDVLAFRALDQSALPEGDLIGSVITDKAFVSTSLSEDQALRFAGFVVDNDGVPVIVDITVPAGTHAGYLEGLLNIQEYELLLQRGSRFRVVSDTIRDGVRHLGMRLIS